MSAVWTVLVLVIGGYILSLTFRGVIEQNLDDRLNSMMDSLIGISGIEFEEDLNLYRALSEPRFEQPYSGWYWQISAKNSEPYRSRSLWDESLKPDMEMDASRSVYYDTTGPEDQSLRAIDRDITIPGSDTVFRYTVAVDKYELESQSRRFDLILVWSLGILGVGLLAASLLQLFFGLQPLRKVRASLSRIRRGQVSRLPDDFPSEIQPLADELNALLDHNDEVIDRSRTQVGNLAHALKTPLAILLNEADLQKGGGFSEMVVKQANAMRRHVDHYLHRARVAASAKVISSRTEVAPVIRDLCRAMGVINRDKVFDISIAGPEEQLVFRGERQDLEEIVGNLLENAGKWAERQVYVHCRREADTIILEISDDGPGIDPAAREAVFTRGERLDEETPGSGLGLSIVQDLISLYGGKISLEDNLSAAEAPSQKGLRVKISLPAAVF
ncbi:HAMP domain-containing sensor histidine kinase [Emcibacter sp.]|uniref:HAMP domain-containing sensor histidine kinase n=1 Tax=Emcibacter sp. TaxID=1979954 RepID=UPI002AA90EF3|nr:HAMP domain-containing sensor histidine kinase [Emcibacter sp.]